MSEASLEIRRNKKLNIRCWNNGIINISSLDCPGEDFSLGKIVSIEENQNRAKARKGKKLYDKEGEGQQYFFEQPEDTAWVLR